MRVYVISALTTLVSLSMSVSYAQTNPPVSESTVTEADSETAVTPTVATSGELLFYFNKAAGEKASSRQPFGSLKVSDKKEGAFFEFEGKRLAKGAYVVVKLPNCDKKSFKTIPEGSELMNFETTYGEISAENTLAQKTISSLEIDKATGKNKVALVKKEKKKPTLLFCGE